MKSLAFTRFFVIVATTTAAAAVLCMSMCAHDVWLCCMYYIYGVFLKLDMDVFK